MGGGGLLIFYVTNVACYKSELKVSYSRRGRLRTRTKCIFVHFVPHFGTFCTGLSRAKAVPLHRISKAR